MKFKNTPNRCLNVDGQEYWISRSVTVLGIIIVTDGEQGYVPLGRRGTALPDEVGKWGLPGGYLDFDETVGEALIREVWEELGLNLLELQTSYHFQGSLADPYMISSAPLRRQNVTLRFSALFEGDRPTELPALNPQVPVSEVETARWVPLTEALKMDLAFRHQDAIHHCLEHFSHWKSKVINTAK